MSSSQQEPELDPSLSTPYTNLSKEPPLSSSSTAVAAETTSSLTNRPISTDRLSTPFPLRLPATTILAFTTGFTLGLTHGSRTLALRFRAENAHRLPTSQVGWYLYHKSKNYHAMLGGIKEGLRMGGRVGLWSGVFFAVEEAVDRARGAFMRRLCGFREERKRRRIHTGLDYDDDDAVDEKQRRQLGLERLGGGGPHGPAVWVQRDFLSTVVAALGTAGAFSAWNRFPVETAARTALMSLKVGFGFGLVQDVLGVMRGRRLGYVEFVKRHVFGFGDHSTNAASASSPA